MTPRKMIAISEKTYHKLAKLGDLEDSFDTVIAKLIQGEKTALTRGSLAGSTESTAATASTEGATGK
ncbi:MAG: hypothetical protein WA461_06520 [Nitrososphaeraceae archaeon]